MEIIFTISALSVVWGLIWRFCSFLDERDLAKFKYSAPACKHPEEDLLEIRSDAFSSRELVATLCTKCDGQLGPEIWQAVLDRKFDEWTRDHETLEEQEAERKRIGDALRAERDAMEALPDAELQAFLDDAKKSLAGTRWSVSIEQDTKRRELSEQCVTWRKELERRGIKEIPSWHKKMQDKLLPEKSEPFDSGSAYMRVMPSIPPDLFSAGAIVGDDFTMEVLAPASAARHEKEAEALCARADVELWGMSHWVAEGWKPTNTKLTTGECTVMLWTTAEDDFRILRFHDKAKYANWAAR